MSTPAAPALQIDVGEAFGYVFRSRNWFGRLAIGALCILLVRPVPPAHGSRGNVSGALASSRGADLT